jgi:hypothetical protein
LFFNSFVVVVLKKHIKKGEIAMIDEELRKQAIQELHELREKENVFDYIPEWLINRKERDIIKSVDMDTQTKELR